VNPSAKQLDQSAIKELEKRIETANKAYWEKNSPTISDEAYDTLVETLRQQMIKHLATGLRAFLAPLLPCPSMMASQQVFPTI